MNIDIAKAKDYVEIGMISAGYLEKAPMEPGYHLLLLGKSGVCYKLETARGETRVFKSVDTAISTAQGIGFEMLALSFGPKVESQIRNLR